MYYCHETVWGKEFRGEVIVKSWSNDGILEWSKFKVFLDDKIRFCSIEYV